jgi:hypothetical protein
MNSNDQNVTWDTIRHWYYPNEGHRYCTLSLVKVLIEAYLNANQQNLLRDEYHRATKTLDAECQQVSVTLGDVIKIFENLHLEE